MSKKSLLDKHSELGRKIRTLRKRNSLTTTELARLAEVSNSYISMLETGDRQPSRDVLLRLTAALFPEGNEDARDELLLLAGFSPLNAELPVADSQMAICEQALEKNERDFESFVALTIALIKAGKNETAQERVQAAFHIFDHSVQWQTLFSLLELTRGNYKKAIISQRSAINYYHISSGKEQSEIGLALLHKNLGVIYFLQGTNHLGKMIQAEEQNQTKKIQQERIMAIENFDFAREQYGLALKMASQDIYILDEYARATFNLAFLSNEEDSPQLWEETIHYFKQVIDSEGRDRLGSDHLLEAAIFLAHAHTKSGRFQQAEYTINLILACHPNYWMAHYVKACYYNLRYEDEAKEEYLNRALKSLEKAISIQDNQNRTSDLASKDPDLKQVREQRRQAFIEIIGCEGER